MREAILLTLPRHDIVTEYLSAFSAPIEERCKKKGILCKPLKDKSANKKEFIKALKKLNCKKVVFNGHGDKRTIAGHNNEFLIKFGDNENILKNRIIYARSCEAASILGKESVKGSNGCFIGYTLPFEFYFNDQWVGNPIKDNTARLFLEPSNLVPISLIKGNSSNEAHKRAKKKMLKNIRKVLRVKTQESYLIAESLWNNYLGQTIIGNKEAKL